jgi:nucleoside-diphosphate-sugar epimerase
VVILKAAAGEPIPLYGDGANVRDWLYVEDHVDALLLAGLHLADGGAGAEATASAARAGARLAAFVGQPSLEALMEELRGLRRALERQQLLEALAALGQPEREETAVVRLRARLALQRILALSAGAAEPDPAGAQP